MRKTARKAPPARLSLRALGRRLGVSDKAIRKGIASGRLRRSVGRDARGPYILDAALAAQEWKRNAAKLPTSGTAAPAPAPTLTPTHAPPVPPAQDDGPTLAEAQRGVALERQTALRLANALKSGRLTDAETARREHFDCARTLRDAFLNIPDRLAGELAAESDAQRVHARLDDEIRKVLEALAEVFAHGE